MNELEARLEAVLFASGDALSVERLAKALGVKREMIYEAAESLSNQYDFERRGILLVRMEDKLQLASRPDYADDIRRATESRRPPSLGPAALEVLTIVAYRQPVTRAFIEQLRGVDSGATVTSLADKGLIEEAGRLDVPGRPILYRTTDAFLRVFSITSLSELPTLPALQTEDEQLTFDDLANRSERTDGADGAADADGSDADGSDADGADGADGAGADGSDADGADADGADGSDGKGQSAEPDS